MWKSGEVCHARDTKLKTSTFYLSFYSSASRTTFEEEDCRLMAVTDRRGRQAPSDNQTPAHSCRRVHTGAISKRLASVTRQGSLLERFYPWRSVNADVICMLGMGCPGMTVSTTRSFTAHLSLQSVHSLTRRTRLVNACRLPPASVCNRH